MVLSAQIPVFYCMLYYGTSRPTEQPSSESPFLNTRGSISSRLNYRASNISLSQFPAQRQLAIHRRNRHRDQLCSKFHFNAQDLSPYSGASNSCSVNNSLVIRKLLPSGFMSESLMLSLLIEDKWKLGYQERRHGMRSSVLEPSQPAAAFKTSGHNDRQCVTCLTELGYEVLTKLTDFKGSTYSVINFNKAFQFIPAGRCVNENSSCGSGNIGKCKQMYRAHWTLVWTAAQAQLAPHEVPSHCECMNIGTASHLGTPPMTTVQLEAPKTKTDLGLLDVY